MVTKEDFLDWSKHPVTQNFMISISHRIEDAKNVLAGQAGIDPLQDRMVCGMIRAFGEVLHVEVDDVIEEN